MTHIHSLAHTYTHTHAAAAAVAAAVVGNGGAMDLMGLLGQGGAGVPGLLLVVGVSVGAKKVSVYVWFVVGGGWV